ncbi:unnamed protein product, partial [Polarella glacialis]
MPGAMKRPAAAMSGGPPGGPLRVACLGDSNTVGCGLGRSGSYPSRLQKILDRDVGDGLVQVRNFGVSGTTAVETPGKKYYVDEEKFQRAMEFGPHYFVVMLGTNDAWHQAGEPDKVADAIDSLLIELGRQGGRRGSAGGSAAGEMASVLIVLPPGAKPGRLLENLKNVHMDMRLRASTWTRDDPDTILVDPELPVETSYRPDLVHLSAEGAETLALAVAKKLMGPRLQNDISRTAFCKCLAPPAMSSLADLSASVHKASPTVDHSTYQYHIKLQLGSASWEVTKRFSEFDTLLQSLGNSRYAGLPRVPAKTLWGSPTDNAAIDARKEQLRIILQDLLLRPDTRTSQQVRTFLSIDSHTDDGAIRTLQPEPLRTFEDPRFGVSGICVAPEANLLLVTHEDSTHLSRLGRVWSVVEPDELGALHLWAKHSDGSWKRSYSQTFGIKVRSLAWESLSRQFFVGLEDGKIQVYAFAEGSTQPDVTCTLELHHKSPVTHLSVSTRKLLSLGLDTAMRVIDVHSRELVCGGRLLKRLRSDMDYLSSGFLDDERDRAFIGTSGG